MPLMLVAGIVLALRVHHDLLYAAQKRRVPFTDAQASAAAAWCHTTRR